MKPLLGLAEQRFLFAETWEGRREIHPPAGILALQRVAKVEGPSARQGSFTMTKGEGCNVVAHLGKKADVPQTGTP